MTLQVYHPRLGERLIPLERQRFEKHAIQGQRHRSSPNVIQLNLFTEASPATRAGHGGVGICYDAWLPADANDQSRTTTQCFVIRGVRDPNECELVAIADSILLVCDLIKQGLPVLEANNWAVKVTIRSDSLSAMAFLRRPGDHSHPSKQRWYNVLGLIERATSEVQSLPVDVRVKYSWMQALCVQNHRFADLFSKCRRVKNGTAIHSRAMAIMYPGPSRVLPATSLPRPMIDSGLTKDVRELSQSTKESVSGRGMLEETLAKAEHTERLSKRCATIDDTIDDCRPHKKARQDSDHTRGNEVSGQSPEVLPHTSTTNISVAVVPSSAGRIEHEATPVHDPVHDPVHIKDEELIISTIKHIIQICRERGSLSIIRRRAEQLQDGQGAMMLDAIEKQIRANQSPADVIPYFPNTLSIIEEATTKLSGQSRLDMQNAVEEQYEEYCSFGIDEAIRRAQNQAQAEQLQKRHSMDEPLMESPRWQKALWNSLLRRNEKFAIRQSRVGWPPCKITRCGM